MHRAVVAADRQLIAARFFRPEGTPRGAVLIVPAMGCTLRGFGATIFDRAKLDCAAMIEAMPERPLYWIGHSLGGQILPLVPNADRVDKAITIAASRRRTSARAASAISAFSAARSSSSLWRAHLLPELA